MSHQRGVSIRFLVRFLAPVSAMSMAATAGAAFAAGPPDWTRWGGPNGNFCVEASGLANSWPEAGPPKLWSRALGQGHSSILAAGEALYTMYRKEEQDVVVALRSDTGATLWEACYDAPMKPNMMLDFGPGPHSTPLLVGDRLFTLSAVVQLHCFDRTTGKVNWKQDLMETLSAALPPRGYGASPVAYKDWIIVNVGSTNAGVVAFRQDNGEVAWKSAGFRTSYPSPVVCMIDGVDHLVVTSGSDRFGLNPETGEVRWKTTHDRESGSIMSTPVFVPPDKVFFSAAYGGGSYLTQVTKKGDGWEAKDLWQEKKMRVQHQTYVQNGDLMFGSSGDFGPAFLMAVKLSDGKVAFRDRGFAKANVVRAGDKFIILDEDGNLALGGISGSGLAIQSRAAVLQNRAWTVPTLVGTTLYVRDYHNIMALDLSAKAASGGGT